MALDRYQQWVADNLAQSGRSQSELARYLGFEYPSPVNKIVKGAREVQAREIPLIAQFFGVSTPDGAQAPDIGAGPQLVPVRVQGTVDAGSWRAVEEYDDITDVWINEPRDERFPQARQFAVDVAGDSMNALKPRPIMPGDRLICVSFEDLEGRVPLRDGMVVVVQQTTMADLRERSVKQLEIYDDRYELKPRSTNSKHKPIVIDKNFEADDGRIVEIVGIVRRITNELPL